MPHKPEPFPQHVRRLRLDAGYTIRELAFMLGVAPGTVVRWEQGEKKPHPGNLRALAELFGVSVAELRPRD